jgi:PAS domain S-box-containing protein
MKFHVPSPKHLWHRLAINQRASITLSIPLFCLVVSLGAYFWMRHSVAEAQKDIDHTNQVLLQSRDISISLLNAESAVRGYYISRQTEFLNSYEQVYITLPQSLNKLKNLVQDNPMQTRRSLEIEKSAQQKMAALTQGIQLSANSSAIKDQLRLGKQIMDRFNAAVKQFDNEELRLLDLRQSNYNFVGSLSTLVIWLGAIISVLGTAVSVHLFKDLTKDLREQELHLQESRNLAQTIVGNVVDGVVVIDGRSRIESLNNAALTMFGYTTADVLGKDWHMLIGSESPILTNQLSQWMGVRHNGAWFPIEISISNIELDDRQLLTIRDITERQIASAQLQSRSDELAKLNLALVSANCILADRNQELDQFAYIISHDLKAPLRAIANLSEWLEADLDGKLPAENQLQLQLLRARVHRMYALLDGVLEYARIGRTEIALETVSVEILLAEIVDILAPPPSFKMEFASPLPTFTTSRVLLRQVLTNLMDNALKYHPDPEQICLQVSVEEFEEYYEFAVTDNGEGIDPEFHQRIFVIFQTLEARDERESTGVGLAIVKKIVEREGGKVSLKSEIGKGSTFSFTWRKFALDLALS